MFHQMHSPYPTLQSRPVGHIIVGKILSFFGYLLPIWAAYHWYPATIEDIDKPPVHFIETLLLAVVFVFAGQLCEAWPMMNWSKRNPATGRKTTSL
jgi:hypothetical protein